MTLATASRSETAGPAEIYDRLFVPALFAHWGPIVADAAAVTSGQQVLDVACGTGALTLAVADRVGPAGHTTGLDPNPEMLAVARGKSAAIDWLPGRAEALPFPDASFDAVVSQFGMMFFSDPVAALGEMRRVLRPDGRVAVAVCDAVEASPGYAALARLLDRLFGKEIGDAFRAPFVLGDPGRLLALARQAGLPGPEIRRESREVRFASIADLVSAERACVWTLGGLLDDDQFERLLREAATELSRFAAPDRGIAFAMPALILTSGGTP